MFSDGDMDLSKCDVLSGCSDEELVSRCKEGRISAPYVSELIYRYFAFIKGKAAVMCGTPSLCDDFVQEGLLGFMNAIRCFDPEKGGSFSAFAHTCVINRMKTAAVRHSRQYESEEGSENEQGENKNTPESILMSRELFSDLERLLSPKEYSIFKLYAAGLSCGEIAGKLGITVKSADNAIQRVRRKLRNELESDGS